MTPDEIAALSAAAWHSMTGPLRPHHDTLRRMLRAAAPDDEVIVTLDRWARESGFASAEDVS